MKSAAQDQRARARERKRRQRARQRAGLEVYRLELDAEVGDALADLGLISPAVSDQPEAVSRALRRLLVQVLGLSS